MLNWYSPVKDHVKARSRRGWRQISTKSKPIGRVEHFCNDLFRQRKISKNDQIAAISKPFDKREIKEHEFEESPLYIDWDQILKITRSFIEKVMNPQTAIENLLEQIVNREAHNSYRKYTVICRNKTPLVAAFVRKGVLFPRMPIKAAHKGHQ